MTIISSPSVASEVTLDQVAYVVDHGGLADIVDPDEGVFAIRRPSSAASDPELFVTMYLTYPAVATEGMYWVYVKQDFAEIFAVTTS